MAGKFSRTGVGHPRTYGPATGGSSAADAGVEAAQPITADDRRAMLRSYFAARGMPEAQIAAHLGKARP